MASRSVLQKPLFVFAQGSLVTALASPTTGLPFGLGDSSSSSQRQSWREVDLALVHIDPTLEPNNPLSDPEAIRLSVRSGPTSDDSPPNKLRCLRGKRSTAFLGVEPPSEWSVALSPSQNRASGLAGHQEGISLKQVKITHQDGHRVPCSVSKGVASSLWESQVMAYFEPGKTLYDVTNTSLRTQLELIALKCNMASYDLLSSPIFSVSDSRYAPFLNDLREKILPSLVVASTIRNAFFGAIGIMTNEATLLKKNKQIEGRNVCAEIHEASDVNIVFSRSKSFCLAVWTALRANLFLLPSVPPLPPPVRPDKEINEGKQLAEESKIEEEHWRRYFTLDGLIQLTESEAPDVFDLNIDHLVALSEEMSPVGVPLLRDYIAQAAARLCARSGVKTSEDVFPFLPYVREVVAVRKARGVVDTRTAAGKDLPHCEAGDLEGASIPPLFCDLFLCVTIKAFGEKLESRLEAAVKNGLVRDLEIVPDEDLLTMNEFLEKVGKVASQLFHDQRSEK